MNVIKGDAQNDSPPQQVRSLELRAHYSPNGLFSTRVTSLSISGRKSKTRISLIHQWKRGFVHQAYASNTECQTAKVMLISLELSKKEEIEFSW
jgi:hypothetical protein